MAANKLYAWQKRGLIALENVIGINQDFEDDVAYLRANIDADYELLNFSPSRLAKKYDLPLELSRCLEHYIASGEVVAELIEPSIQIVSDKMQTAEPGWDDKHVGYNAYMNGDGKSFIKLVIPSNTTQAELIDFIKVYRRVIEANLDSLETSPRKRTRKKKKEMRDQDILKLHKLGKSAKQIANEIERLYPNDSLPITDADVRLVISRKSKRIT